MNYNKIYLLYSVVKEFGPCYIYIFGYKSMQVSVTTQDITQEVHNRTKSQHCDGEERTKKTTYTTQNTASTAAADIYKLMLNTQNNLWLEQENITT